jgi:hypothetical protein
MRCSNCGAQLQEGDKFCTSCGAKVEQQPQQTSQQNSPPPPRINTPPQQQSYTAPTPPPPSNFSNGNPPPVGVLKYLLVNILLVIPLSFKGNINPSLKNYARALLIFMILGVVLMVATGTLQLIIDMFTGGFNPNMNF